MTVGTHVAEILRQGVWASLTGGWYYEPAHSTFCNTVHLYLWIVLLILPLLLGLVSTGTLSLGLVAAYSTFICLLFAAIKMIVAYLHRVFDTTEPIIVTKKCKEEKERMDSRERLSSTAVRGSRSGDQGFEMMEMTEMRTNSSSPRPGSLESRRRVSEVSSRSGDRDRRRHQHHHHRVRITDHTDPYRDYNDLYLPEPVPPLDTHVGDPLPSVREASEIGPSTSLWGQSRNNRVRSNSLGDLERKHRHRRRSRDPLLRRKHPLADVDLDSPPHEEAPMWPPDVEHDEPQKKRRKKRRPRAKLASERPYEIVEGGRIVTIEDETVGTSTEGTNAEKEELENEEADDEETLEEIEMEEMMIREMEEKQRKSRPIPPPPQEDAPPPPNVAPVIISSSSEETEEDEEVEEEEEEAEPVEDAGEEGDDQATEDSRRAQQREALSALSDLTIRDGTHIASGHEDTTQGAIHSFQDEDGNWWTYAFDENGVGTAQVLGSGKALRDLLSTAPPPPTKRLEAVNESPDDTSGEESPHPEPEPGPSRRNTESTSKSQRQAPSGGTRSRAASSSSTESQAYIAGAPSTVLHAGATYVAASRSASQPPRSIQQAQAHVLSMAAHRLRAVLNHESRDPTYERTPREETHMRLERPFYELNNRLRQLNRLDSTHSTGSSSSRFRLLSELGIAPPLDRLQVVALFDRPRSIYAAMLDIFLALAVSLLAAQVISKGIYHDINLFAFAFVVAGSHFSMLKSVQPDAASPIHGFNWIVAYSRPIYFCILASLLLWLHSAAGVQPDDERPWNWNFYNVPWNNAYILLSIRDLVATGILFLPVAFTIGWLPQINTLSLHILEQIQMHFFGGTACTSVYSALLQIAISLFTWSVLSAGTYCALTVDSKSTQTVSFSIMSAITVAMCFLLSRLPSAPIFMKLGVAPLKCSLLDENFDPDDQSDHSGSRLLCTSKSRHPVQEAQPDDWIDDSASSPRASSSPLPHSHHLQEDPLPALLSQTMSLRIRHDLLFSFILALIVFALHSTSLFTATSPYFTLAISLVAIFFGIFNHYLYVQLRTHNPWKLLARPLLKSAEYGQFESTKQAHLMCFEVAHVWSGILERNVVYPLLVVSTITEYGWRIPYPVVFLPLFCIKILRTGYCAPQALYIPLGLSFLLARFDCVNSCSIPFFPQLTSLTDLFPMVFLTFAVIYPKWHELYLKLSFVLAYVAPWQISWGSAFHAFAQPFSVPHSGIVCIQTLFSSLVSAPLNPFLGSSFFLTSYVRPVKFWERDYNTKRADASNTRLASQIDRGPMIDDSNLNAVFYEHLTRSLQASLAGDLRLGRWASTVHPGDCFILASFYLNCLVHIIEVGNGERWKPSAKIPPMVRVVVVVPPAPSPGFLSLNTAWTLRWLAWEVTASKYIISGYSITDNSAVNLLQVHELRRLLVSLFVKCIIYFAMRAGRLRSWLTNDTIQTSLHPIESRTGYADVDSMFCQQNDEDYDPTCQGISRNSFSYLYSAWIDYCLKKRMEADGELEVVGDRIFAFCFAASLLGRRALGAAAYNRHSTAAESFLYGLHALFKGDFRVTCQRDEWVFADVEILRSVIAPAVRMALKLHQDHFAAADEFDDGEAMYSMLESHEAQLFISHEHDPGWRQAILANTPSLLALRHIYDDGQDDYKIIMLNKMHLNMRVIKLNRECVRAFWAGQQQELIFLRNRNPERGSIQNARQVLRNMINSSADQPVGYPIYVSPLTTSFVETHPQIRQVQGPPLTLQGIGSFLGRCWDGLLSHFGTSVSSQPPPSNASGTQMPASGPAANISAPPAPPTRPLATVHNDNQEPDRISSGSSQHEQSVVLMMADGDATTESKTSADSLEAVPGSSDERQTSGEGKSLKEDDEPNTYVAITDVEQIFQHLNEPLKATGEPLVVWPKEQWRLLGGRNYWDHMPMKGATGRILHSWYPNHPQRAMRSHIGDTIHLIQILEMPIKVVPVAQKGLRFLTAEEAELARHGVEPLDSLQTLREALGSCRPADAAQRPDRST
ncbi:unnamed protein product, partial [Mesorhabditis spiculigera]